MTKLPTSYTGRSSVQAGGEHIVYRTSDPDTLEQRIAAGKAGPAASHPTTATDADYDVVTLSYGNAYAVCNDENNTWLIIVPARNEHEAETGSGILAIGNSRTHAWYRAARACK